MVRHFHDQPAFAESFLTLMLTRNIRIEEDLVDQLFNSSEKRWRVRAVTPTVLCPQLHSNGAIEGEHRYPAMNAEHQFGLEICELR